MRIALIHAVPVAILPVEDAFQRHWPQAERINLLDDALSVDRNRAGASGILYTCSAFGYAIEAVKQRVRMPVLKPNEAMFAEAIARGSRLGCSLRFRHASTPWRAGTRSARAPHVELLAAVAPKLGHCDVLMLAQVSTARARAAVADVVKCPVLASPDSAVLAMRKLLGNPSM